MGGFQRNITLMSYFKLSSQTQQNICFVFLFLSLIVLPLMIRLTIKKIKKTKDPSINNSYCVISIAMLRIIMMSYVILWLVNVTIIILSIFEINLEVGSNLYIILNLITAVCIICGKINLYLQGIEWIVMIYIIRTQKQKTLG